MRDDINFYQELRAAVRKAGGVRAYARANNISAAHISDVLNGSREPGPKVLAPLKIEKQVARVVHYYRAEC